MQKQTMDKYGQHHVGLSSYKTMKFGGPEGIARISYSKFVVSNQYAKKTLSFPFLPQTPAAPQKAE